MSIYSFHFTVCVCALHLVFPTQVCAGGSVCSLSETVLQVLGLSLALTVGNAW